MPDQYHDSTLTLSQNASARSRARLVSNITLKVLTEIPDAVGELLVKIMVQLLEVGRPRTG
jgi:hypothetical protein